MSRRTSVAHALTLAAAACLASAQGTPSIGSTDGTTITANAQDLRLVNSVGSVVGSLSNTVAQLSTTTTLANALSNAVSAQHSTASAQSTQLSAAVSSVLSSVAAVNTSVQEASNDAQANSILFGQLSAQISTQMGFSGAAASEAYVQSTAQALASQLSTVSALLARFEQHDQLFCSALCTQPNGQCVNSSTTGLLTCQCNAGYSGPFCTVTSAPTNAPTNAPTMPPTFQTLTSCAQATVSGTYAMQGGFDAYCLVPGGNQPNWMKINYWTGGSYRMTTAAINGGDCATASPSGSCKLSDAQINSVFPSANSARQYWLDTSVLTDSMWIRTNRPYIDTTVSFNVDPTSCVARTGSTYPGANFAGTAFRGWIDFLYVSNGSYRRGEACERFFIGHGANDCWSGAGGVRCIRGGAGCSRGRYAMIPGWTMWVAAA